MRYLLINHVPFGRGSAEGKYVVGDMWLEDLRAQARAVREAGMELVVATPLVEKLEMKGSGSFNVVEITPREHGFEYQPLPFYISMKQFLLTKSKVIQRLAEVMRDVDIVQMGYGGHPVALGEIALPLAERMRKKVIWVFDGADPFPRLELHAKQQKNPIKRLLQQMLVKRFAATCRNAVKNSDLVFAHNAAVVERFRDVWDERRCHAFDRSFVTDGILLSDAELAERQRRLRDTSKPLRLVAAGRPSATPHRTAARSPAGKAPGETSRSPQPPPAARASAGAPDQAERAAGNSPARHCRNTGCKPADRDAPRATSPAAANPVPNRDSNPQATATRRAARRRRG